MLCPLFRAKASWGQASLESTDSDTWIEMKAEFDFRKPVVPALVAWVWRVSRRSSPIYTGIHRSKAMQHGYVELAYSAYQIPLPSHCLFPYRFQEFNFDYSSVMVPVQKPLNRSSSRVGAHG